MLASLTPYLAEGLRRAILLTALSGDGAEDPAVGLVLLDDDNSIETANPAARMWLDELGGEDRLPVVVQAVAGRARSSAPAIAAATRSPRAGADGLGTVAAGAGIDARRLRNARAAVILEPARSPELAPLIADAYGLTERERRVTQLVAQGRLTREIANELHLSPYTVQDHLKSIFEKVGVGSRGELVARIFFEHYAPD